MWKKRLIIVVTFLAGLYYFLEFAVPATVPFKTVSGVVISATDNEIEVARVKETGSTFITEKTEITKVPLNGGEPERMPPDSLKSGDLVTVTTLNGGTISGIVMPGTSLHKIRVGRVEPGSIQTIEIQKNTSIRRFRMGGSADEVGPKALHTMGNVYDRSADWVSVGPTTYLTSLLTSVNDVFIVLASMAWGMGLLSLWLVHSANIRKRRPEWYTSVIFFAAVAAGICAGIGFGVSEGSAGWRGFALETQKVVYWQILRPMGSTIFSLLTFFLASAAYRSFKAKSPEAVLMMASALIVMLGQISLSVYVTSASTWILYIINSAAVRGMWFGMMLGAIAIGLRMWLSLERGAFFDREL